MVGQRGWGALTMGGRGNGSVAMGGSGTGSVAMGGSGTGSLGEPRTEFFVPSDSIPASGRRRGQI